MDAVQQFMKSDAAGNLPIESFVVSGGSKARLDHLAHRCRR